MYVMLSMHFMSKLPLSWKPGGELKWNDPGLTP